MQFEILLKHQPYFLSELSNP